jgi:hypothetical protein
VTAPDEDASLVGLVADLDGADDELRGRLARDLEARGAIEAAGRTASSTRARPRSSWAA